MTVARAQTMQQKFGFQDKELSTPKHDELMLWLDLWIDNHLSDLLMWRTYQVYRWKGEIPGDAIKKETVAPSDAHMSSWKEVYSAKRNQWGGRLVGEDGGYQICDYEYVRKSDWERVDQEIDIVPPPFPIIKPSLKKWECPIVDRTYTVGFCDMRVSYTKPTLLYHADLNRFQIGSGGDEGRLYFEVKPSIPSLGEVIRQVRMYQTYTDGKWFIVSPDARFKSQIEAQGIGFIESV